MPKRHPKSHLPKRKRCKWDLKVDDRSSPFGQCWTLGCSFHSNHWCSGCMHEASLGCEKCGNWRKACFYCPLCWNDHKKAFPRHESQIIPNSKV